MRTELKSHISSKHKANTEKIACDICKKEGSDKFESPLVQVKAKKIIHDKKEQTVRFYDSYLDVKGKSIFYLPYFSVASPLVKRKAGFIAPSYKQNYYFGFSADIPYYIPISDYQDVTIQPKFSQKKTSFQNKKLFTHWCLPWGADFEPFPA